MNYKLTVPYEGTYAVFHKDGDRTYQGLLHTDESSADDPAAVERVLDHLVKGAPQDVKDAIWETQEFRDYCRPYAQEMLRAAERGEQ